MNEQSELPVMKRYIGTKVVQAIPCVRLNGTLYTYDDPVAFRVAKGMELAQEGYKVIYPDGYESYSPKKVFEEAYRQTDDLSFGLAIEAAKKGKKIARRGWNGKEQYVELATSISYKGSDGILVNCAHYNIGNQCLAFFGTSGVQMGWLASQADMLADDWYIKE